MKLNYIIIITLIVLLSSCGKKIQETKPIRKTITKTVFASGILEASNTYHLVAQTDGELVEINFKENDIIKQGQILAVVDNKQNSINLSSANALYNFAERNTQPNAPQLAQAKIVIENTKKQLDFDELYLNKVKKLFENNSIARIEVENAEMKFTSSKADYEKALQNFNLQQQQAVQQVIINSAQQKANTVLNSFNQVKALFNGKVYQKLKQKGDFVSKGEVIAIIGDANNIYAKVSIDESNINKVKIGQEVVLQLNTNKEKNYRGKVQEILPSFNEQMQSFTCKIFFNERLDFQIINTQLQANIITGTEQSALLIPRNYLQYGNMVSIKGEKEPVKIKTNFISTDWVQVLSGIDENTVIITDKIK